MSIIEIIPFDNAVHRGQVVALWDATLGYNAPHNKPTLSIDKKVAANDELFFVAMAGTTVAGSVMAGYDGHRGWIYSIAVSPTHQRQGIGTRLLRYAEKALIDRGCVKINLQIMEGNEAVTQFYVALGYTVEKRISMGKRIVKSSPSH
jgi:ribosomal protein S18 acetylase RimI-like enzyme